VYLKAWDEHDHHSVVLRQAETPGMDYYGFKVDSKATLWTNWPILCTCPIFGVQFTCVNVRSNPC